MAEQSTTGNRLIKGRIRADRGPHRRTSRRGIRPDGPGRGPLRRNPGSTDTKDIPACRDVPSPGSVGSVQDRAGSPLAWHIRRWPQTRPALPLPYPITAGARH